MGNRTGNPPEQYRDDEDDEQPESQPETDDTQQTEIEDVTQPEHDDEETPKEDSDMADAPDESRDSGGVGGGVVNVPTGSQSDDQQPADNDLDEVNDEAEHSGAEKESDPESDEQNDTEDDEFKFVYGDIVNDREAKPSEDEDWEDMVVVNLPDNTIGDWNCGYAETLADRNPGYPHTDSVVVGVTLETLSAEVPGWGKRHEEIPLETLDDNSIDYSCYPSLRLKLEEPSHLRTL